MKLYTCYRSSASCSVRIALNLKKLNAEYEYVNLSESMQFENNFEKINPFSMEPILIDNEVTVSQSLAIIEYLEDTYNSHPLLPNSINEKSFIKSFVLDIACEIQPFGNIRPLQFLKNCMKISDNSLLIWNRHWISLGLSVLERKLEKYNHGMDFCFTQMPSLADVFLIPQLISAQRCDVEIMNFKNINKIYQNALNLPEFHNALPHMQEDYVNE